MVHWDRIRLSSGGKDQSGMRKIYSPFSLLSSASWSREHPPGRKKWTGNLRQYALICQWKAVLFCLEPIKTMIIICISVWQLYLFVEYVIERSSCHPTPATCPCSKHHGIYAHSPNEDWITRFSILWECLSTRGGTPSPSHKTPISTGPMSFLGVSYLHPIILPLVPGPFWEVPLSLDRVPHNDLVGVPPTQSGLDGGTSSQDWMGCPQLGLDGGTQCLGLDGTWTGYAAGLLRFPRGWLSWFPVSE